MMPKLSRVAVLGNPGSSTEPAILKSITSEAQKIGVQVFSVKARTPEEIEDGFATMKQSRADGVIIALDALMVQQIRQIALLAMRHRLPSITQATDYPEAGGLMGYGQNFTENFMRSATYVDRILKGAKPGELPVEQPTKLSLIVNRKTAKALGLLIPDTILLRAEKVID
jgi:putative ABC transport system substrate-binding protein